MVTIQFQAKVKDGIIRIPPQYQGQFGGQVRVILRADAKNVTTHNYLDFLMENPVKIDKFKALARDQIYDR